jgi:hypothetical protein
MKIAVCMWGICRSSVYTVDSWKEYIIRPLQEGGHTVDVLIHTYNVTGVYNNPRAKEYNQRVDNNAWKLFNPTHILTDDQDTVVKTLHIDKYKSFPDPWGLSYDGTFVNHILALYSLRCVTQLWKAEPVPYDIIIYCRPDVKYLMPIPLQYVTKDLSFGVIPNFHLYSKYKINDRFFIGNPTHAAIYGERFNTALEYSKKHPLHSETLLGHILKQHNVVIKRVSFPFQRVRCTGEICPSDATLNTREIASADSSLAVGSKFATANLRPPPA